MNNIVMDYVTMGKSIIARLNFSFEAKIIMVRL